MAGNVVNIKVFSPLKLRKGLTGNYHAIRFRRSFSVGALPLLIQFTVTHNYDG